MAFLPCFYVVKEVSARHFGAGGRFEVLAEGDDESEGDIEGGDLAVDELGAVPVPSLPVGYVPAT